MSTYALMSLCNAAIIYGTKMGVELTSVGPAGHRRGRGVDSKQGADARRQLTCGVLPDPLRIAVQGTSWRPAARARTAIRLPLLLQSHDSRCGFIDPKAGYPIYRLKLDSLRHLLPGASEGLDTICDGILERRPFVCMPATGRRLWRERRSVSESFKGTTVISSCLC